MRLYRARGSGIAGFERADCSHHDALTSACVRSVDAQAAQAS